MTQHSDAPPLSRSLSRIESILGHRFADQALLRQALTHSSASAINYERLEFLGDRVVNLALADLLYARYPNEDEGGLAKRYAALARGATMAEIAAEIGLTSELIHTDPHATPGENQLADALEAVFGALYLETGYAPCRKLVETLWGERIEVMTRPPRDPKTELQEWAQGRGLPAPSYEIVGRSGPDHAPEFEILVCVEGHEPIRAKGPSRRAAEKAAAKELLDHLHKKAGKS